MDLFNLPPVPDDEQNPTFGFHAPLDFTDRILSVPGTGYQVAIGGSDAAFDPFHQITPEAFRAMVEKLGDYFNVNVAEAFPPTEPERPVGEIPLGEGEEPESIGRVVKRGSKRSINAFLKKIPGWQEYFAKVFDAENDEWVVVELKQRTKRQPRKNRKRSRKTK